MADVRTALFAFLRSQDDHARQQLEASVGDVELAAARKAAAEQPDSSEAAAAVLGRLVIDRADQAEIIDAAKLLAQRAPRDGSGTDVALLAGNVVWSMGDQPQLAEPYFRRVRRTDPASPDVLAFYRELFPGETGASQLMQVLVQARRGTEDAQQRFALAEEMAQLAEQQLKSADRAIEVWRSVLREDGHDSRAIAALERLYRDNEKWTALVELLKDEFDRIPDEPGTRQERIDKLLEIARLYREHVNLDTMALATLQRVLDIDPRHEASLQALADTYAKAGRWNDLLGVYARRIDGAKESGDQQATANLLRKVGEIWVEQLGNPQRALEPLQQVLEIDPKDPQARQLLARIHEQRRDWRALIALRREELQDGESEQALKLRIDLAQLAEDKLGDRREAIAAWNEVVEHHGDVPESLDALARLYERESRWASAAEILRRKLEKTEAREDAIGLLLKLGSIYSDRIRSREDALPVWQELARIAPGHDKATRMLRDSYVASGRWDELTALYETQDRIGDLVEVLQGAADRVAEIDERVQLYRRVADLCRDRLGQPERAVKALERTLSLQPDNLDVARQLLPIYEEQSNWARLMSTYEVLLRAAEDDDERLRIIGAMRDVAEYKLGSATLTLQWAARAYEIRPSDESLREGLEKAAEMSDGWDELTRIYEQRIAQEHATDRERLMLLDKLAVIARDRLFKPDDAQRYFRRIITLDPSNAEAMAALEEIYSSTRRWDDLTEVYRKRLEVTEEPKARLQTLRGLAKIHEQQLGDLDAAVDSLEKIVDIEPEDLEALQGLARIHRNRGQWEPLAEILQRLLDLTRDESSRVPFLFELGQVHATRLQQSGQAVGEFLQVLEIDPMHKPTVEALEGLRQSDPTASLPIMRGLLSYYRRVGAKAKEAEAMEVVIAAEDDQQARLEQLRQLAAIYEKMEDRQADALRVRSELFEAVPGTWENRQTLKRLARELQASDVVANSYQNVLLQLADRARDAEQEGHTLPREDAVLRRDLLLEYAELQRGDLGRPELAEQAYREVLDQDETHQGAYEALEALLKARDASEELVRLYRRRVDVVFNQREQKQLLSRIVDISRNVLRDRKTAIATAEELLDLIPDDLPTIELLAQMYDEGQEPHDKQQLEELLGRWAELVSDAERRHALLCRRAELRMQFLGDAFGAVDLLGQVLGEDADHADAKRLLEELLDISDVQIQACALLEPIYLRQGEQHGRIRTLQVRRNHAESHGLIDEAVTRLLEIANIEENELGSTEPAFTTMRDAYLMDPRRQDTRDEFERLGLLLGKERELVEVWRAALANDVADRPLRIDLTHRIARLLDERLDDPEGARRTYAEVLELDPPDARLAQRAVTSLCRLHEEAGDFLALVDTKRALLRFTNDTGDQVGIHLELADIQERQLFARVESALTYSEVLDMQPDNERALGALERLFEEEGEWERLCEVLQHRAAVVTDPRARATIWRRVGEIRRDRLDDPHRAIEAFQSMLDLKAGRDDTIYALQSLVALHEQLERWPDVEEELRRLVALATDDRDRVDLLVRTAEVVGKKLERSDDALDLLKRVLELSSTEVRARSLVSGYLESDDTRERAIRILTPLYEAEQNWSGLLSLEELQARHQPSGRRRLQALLRVAKTHEERLGAPGAAFEVLCSAMQEAADQPELAEVLDKVERLGSEPERAESLLQAYSNTVEHILDSDLQQRVLRSIGKVALERLGELARARKAYESVLEVAPDDPEATDALEQIYIRQDDHEALAKLLVRRSDRVEDTAQRDDILIRAAEIYRTVLDQPEDAIQLYERLSSDGLARPNVQSVLEPLYEITGRYRELAAHLNRKLVRLQGKPLVDTHLRLGRLYGQELDDPEEGIRHLSMALRLDPDHAVATEELNRYLEDESMRAKAAEMLEPVFAAVQDWARLIQIQEIRLVEGAGDPALRSQILLKIAQLEEEQLEDLDRAFDSYTRLFKEQPSHRYVRDQLARLSGVLDKTERYAQLLTEYVNEEAAGDDRDEVLDIVREAADLWIRALRKPATAVPLYERLLVARPEDERAFASLEQALSQAEMWRELIDAYWRESDSTLDDARRVELLRRLATVASDVLDEPEEAARAFQRILEIRPDHDAARRSLERIYERSGRHHDLLDLLRDRLARTEAPNDRADVYLRMAEVQNGPLEEPDAAVDSIESLLGDAPGHSEAVALLERIAEARKNLRLRILPILRPIYQESGNTRRLIEIDEWQLAVTEDPVARHELFREMADLAEHGLQDPEAAFRILARAVCEPGPENVLQTLDAELVRVAQRLQMPGALADALVAAAAAEKLEGDTDRRLDLLVRAARLQLESGEPSQAVDILHRALELSSEHAPALALLDACLVRLGYHEQLRSVLERRVAVAYEDRERVELLRRLAVLLEETLVDTKAAEQAWRDLLDLEPEDQEALARLSRTYEQTGSTDELVEVLRRRCDASEDPEERRELRMRLAGILREAAKDRAAEIDVLRDLLVERPADDDAMATLVRALVAEERHAEAAEVIQERAALADSNERKATLLLEAARIYVDPLGDAPGALERYEQILDLVPGQDGAVGDLVALAKQPDSSEAAAGLVIRHLESSERYSDLVAVYEARAELTMDPEERIHALRALARLRLDKLDDASGSLEVQRRLIDVLSPETLPDVLVDAGRLAVQLGATDDHVRALAERAQAEERDPRARVLLAQSGAELAEEISGDRARAVELLRPLLDTGLADPQLCERLERLASSNGDLELVVQTLREWSRLVEAPDAQAQILVRMGGVLLDLGRGDEAVDAFRDALDLQSGHSGAVAGLERVVEGSEESPAPAALDALESAYQSTGSKAGQAAVVRRRLQTADEADQPALLQSLAVLLEDGGGALEDAVTAWGQLLARDPQSVQALERIVALGRQHGMVERVAALMMDAIERVRADERNATPLALAAAGLLLDDLNDGARATTALQAVLSENPEHPEGLQLLVRAARATGDRPALHEALVRSARAQVDPSAAVPLWSEAASVAEHQLGDSRLAIEDLENLLEDDESEASAWQKLLGLLTAQGDAEALADALGRRILITPDIEERLELRYRLANLLVDKLDQGEDAVTVYNDMLADRPDDLSVLQELEILLRRLERWEDVREVLERKLEAIATEQRAPVLEEIARVSEDRLEDASDAIERHHQILRERPDHEGAEAALERLLAAEQRWEALADLLEQKMDRLREVDDTEGYRTTASRLAEMLAERLDDTERAERILDQLLEVDPGYVPAILALAAVHEFRGEEKAMTETLQRAVEQGPEGELGAMVQLRLARLTDEPEVQRDHLEKALQLDPGNEEAAERLLELSRSEQNWEQVVYLLELAAGRITDEQKRRDLLLERVDLMLTELDDVDGALRLLASQYEKVQDDVEVNRRIADALFRAERFEEAAGMYHWLVEVGRRTKKRSKTLAHDLTRMAQILLRNGGSGDARELLLEAYRIDTTNVETLLALGRIHEQGGEWRDALKVYRTMLLQNADRTGMLRRGDLYASLARAHLALDEKPKALAMLRRGLEEDAEHPELSKTLQDVEAG